MPASNHGLIRCQHVLLAAGGVVVIPLLIGSVGARSIAAHPDSVLSMKSMRQIEVLLRGQPVAGPDTRAANFPHTQHGGSRNG